MFSLKKISYLALISSMASFSYLSTVCAADFPDAYTVSQPPVVSEKPSSFAPERDTLPSEDLLDTGKARSLGTSSDGNLSQEDVIRLVEKIPPKYRKYITPEILKSLIKNRDFDNPEEYGLKESEDNSKNISDNKREIGIIKNILRQDNSISVGISDVDDFLDKYGRDRILALTDNEIAYIYRASINKAELGGAYVDQFGLAHNGSVIIDGVKVLVPPMSAQQKRSGLSGGQLRAADSPFPGSSNKVSSRSGNAQSETDWFFNMATASWSQYYASEYGDE